MLICVRFAEWRMHHHRHQQHQQHHHQQSSSSLKSSHWQRQDSNAQLDDAIEDTSVDNQLLMIDALDSQIKQAQSGMFKSQQLLDAVNAQLHSQHTLMHSSATVEMDMINTDLLSAVDELFQHLSSDSTDDTQCTDAFQSLVHLDDTISQTIIQVYSCLITTSNQQHDNSLSDELALLEQKWIKQGPSTAALIQDRIWTPYRHYLLSERKIVLKHSDNIIQTLIDVQEKRSNYWTLLKSNIEACYDQLRHKYVLIKTALHELQLHHQQFQSRISVMSHPKYKHTTESLHMSQEFLRLLDSVIIEDCSKRPVTATSIMSRIKSVYDKIQSLEQEITERESAFQNETSETLNEAMKLMAVMYAADPMENQMMLTDKKLLSLQTELKDAITHLQPSVQRAGRHLRVRHQ